MILMGNENMIEVSAVSDPWRDCIFIVPKENAVEARKILLQADFDYWDEDVVNQPYGDYFSSWLQRAGIPFKYFKIQKRSKENDSKEM